MEPVVITVDFFNPESEMLLWKKTEGNNDNRSKQFWNGGIKMKILNHYIDDRII